MFSFPIFKDSRLVDDNPMVLFNDSFTVYDKDDGSIISQDSPLPPSTFVWASQGELNTRHGVFAFFTQDFTSPYDNIVYLTSLREYTNDWTILSMIDSKEPFSMSYTDDKHLLFFVNEIDGYSIVKTTLSGGVVDKYRRYVSSPVPYGFVRNQGRLFFFHSTNGALSFDYSDDGGDTWTHHNTAITTVPNGYNVRVGAYRGYLTVFFGEDWSNGDQKCFVSTDKGISWTEYTNTGPETVEYGYGNYYGRIRCYDGKLFYISFTDGTHGSMSSGDTWYTTNGYSWTKLSDSYKDILYINNTWFRWDSAWNGGTSEYDWALYKSTADITSPNWSVWNGITGSYTNGQIAPAALTSAKRYD